MIGTLTPSLPQAVGELEHLGDRLVEAALEQLAIGDVRFVGGDAEVDRTVVAEQGDVQGGSGGKAEGIELLHLDAPDIEREVGRGTLEASMFPNLQAPPSAGSCTCGGRSLAPPKTWADTVGSAYLYPFDPGEAVVEKLTFVHARVTARRQHFNRDDAIAAPSAPDPPTT